MSDSMALPARSSAARGQSVSWNMLTSRPVRDFRAASPVASWAVTAQPIKSLALTGPANYKYAVAQAGSAVAMSQIERSSQDALPKNLRKQQEDGGNRRLLSAHWVVVRPVRHVKQHTTTHINQ